VLVSLFKALEGRRKITGLIEKVEGDIVTLEEAGQHYDIPFSAMSKARLIPDLGLFNPSIEKGARSGK
jgi:ribosome maturation factor RimP